MLKIYQNLIDGLLLGEGWGGNFFCF